jgi:hypothetical protein
MKESPDMDRIDLRSDTVTQPSEALAVQEAVEAILAG